MAVASILVFRSRVLWIELHGKERFWEKNPSPKLSPWLGDALRKWPGRWWILGMDESVDARTDLTAILEDFFWNTRQESSASAFLRSKIFRDLENLWKSGKYLGIWLHSAFPHSKPGEAPSLCQPTKHQWMDGCSCPSICVNSLCSWVISKWDPGIWEVSVVLSITFLAVSVQRVFLGLCSDGEGICWNLTMALLFGAAL